MRFFEINIILPLLIAAAGLFFDIPQASGQLKLPEDINTEQLMKTASLSEKKTTAVVALEGVIDPAVYKLGPGDVLEFRIWGNIELQQEVIVAPDGTIALSNIGEAKVADLTIIEADSLVKRLAQASYSRSKVNLRLVGVRSMKASISGVVEVPGVYELTAIDRLSSLIAFAGGFVKSDETKSEETQALKTKSRYARSSQVGSESEASRKEREKEIKPSLRRIVIMSREGSLRTVDYQRFIRTGDAAFNPILNDGDQVNVPPLQSEVGVVNVFGAVLTPGEYEYVSGDKVRDIIDIAGGFRIDAEKSAVVIVRFDETGRRHEEIIVDMQRDDAEGIELMPDDRVFVRRLPDFRRKYNVVVRGEIVYPGTYSIENDVTKLTELIEICGGFTNRANLRSARVLRQSLRDAIDPEFERLREVPFADMNAIEYGYFKTKLRDEVPGVVVDFHSLFVNGDTGQDIRLQDGDEIVIPTLSPTVTVIGQVNNPGLVRYTTGKNFEYYIEKAGGYSWNARKGALRLIKAHTGTWVKPKKRTTIEIGDTIFIPEKTETDWWEVWKDILLVASQVATIILVIRAI